MVGVSVSEMNAEIKTAMETVTANSWNISPMMPLISSSGMKTAIRENVIDRMVKPISPAPFTAA